MLFANRSNPAFPLPGVSGAETAPAASLWLTRAFDCLVVLACGLVLSRNFADPDFWGHVQYGRDLLRDGLPYSATYSYTALLFPWINHENLSEIAFAAGLMLGGPTLLLTAKVIIGMIFSAALMRRARAAANSMLVSQGIALLTAVNLMYFWTLRPQIFSFAFFIIEIAILDWSFRDWKNAECELPRMSDFRPMLWGLPMLFGVWANTHGGFVLGIAVLTAYLLLRVAQGCWRWRAAAWPYALAFLAIITLCLLATFINPYGLRLHWWLFEDLRVPRPEIIEWRPPQLLDILWWQWWVLVVLAVLAIAVSSRRADVVETVIMGIVLWQSLEHLRHIPFFAILGGMWLPPHLASLGTSVSLSSDDKPLGSGWTRCQRYACGGGMLVIAILIAAQLTEQLRRIPVHRASYPVAALKYIVEQNISGRLIARFKWSQYVLAACGSNQRDRGIQLAFDGRFRTCYPQEVADMYFDFAVSDVASNLRPRSPKSPSPDRKRLLYFAGTDLVLIDHTQQLPRQTMREESERWVLLYQDEIAELWGSRDKYDRPESPHYLPPSRRHIAPHERQAGVVPWPALPGVTTNSSNQS